MVLVDHFCSFWAFSRIQEKHRTDARENMTSCEFRSREIPERTQIGIRTTAAAAAAAAAKPSIINAPSITGVRGPEG